MKAMTDPKLYCKDIGSYEKCLVTAIDRLNWLFQEGYVSFTGKPCKELWYGLVEGLYGKELEDGE